MSLQHLRTGDKALVIFRFIKNPEFLRVGSKLIFREGRTKAIGTITRVNLTGNTKTQIEINTPTVNTTNTNATN